MRFGHFRIRRPASRRGFTMIELAVASVINLIAFLGAFSVFLASSRMQRDIFFHNLVDGEARIVEHWLVNDIRSAMSLEDTLSYAGTTYTAGDETLILRLPAVDAQGDPVDIQPEPVDTASDFIVYYHNGDKHLCRLLVRHAESWRDGSNAPADDRLLGRSTDPGIGFVSAFSEAPSILEPTVVHYEFRSSRFDPRRGANPNPYTLAVAGSVYLRNRPNSIQ